MPVRGLIIGKFYPPHIGHKFLIDTACRETDRVTVLLCTSASDLIAPGLRLQWLRTSHPGTEFLILDQDAIDRNDPHAWIAATRRLVALTPDIVFSSEEYGIRYAELLGCRHRMVDRHRLRVPCSGTQIRQDPIAWSRFLEPHVREYFSGSLPKRLG